MDPKKHFATNLRTECLRFKSIAHICRGTGINRQQFNKYLAGQFLPNQNTRKKLSAFLGIAEDKLFRDPNAIVHDEVTSSSDAVPIKKNLLVFLTQAAETLAQLGLGSPTKKSNFQSGYYLCYFPLQGYQDILVRTLVKISKRDNFTVFNRHTFFKSAQFPARTISKSRHLGIILESRNETYLLATKTSEPFHLSVMTISDNPNYGGTIKMGLALTRGTNNSFSSRVCLQFVGSEFSAGKHCAKLSGVVKSNDPSVPQSIALAMAAKSETIQGQLGIPNIEEMLMFYGDLNKVVEINSPPPKKKKLSAS